MVGAGEQVYHVDLPPGAVCEALLVSGADSGKKSWT